MHGVLLQFQRPRGESVLQAVRRYTSYTYLSKKKACLFLPPEIYSQDVTVEPERRGAHVAEEGLGASIFDNLDLISSSLDIITNR